MQKPVQKPRKHTAKEMAEEAHKLLSQLAHTAFAKQKANPLPEGWKDITSKPSQDEKREASRYFAKLARFASAELNKGLVEGQHLDVLKEVAKEQIYWPVCIGPHAKLNNEICGFVLNMLPIGQATRKKDAQRIGKAGRRVGSKGSPLTIYLTDLCDRMQTTHEWFKSFPPQSYIKRLAVAKTYREKTFKNHDGKTVAFPMDSERGISEMERAIKKKKDSIELNYAWESKLAALEKFPPDAMEDLLPVIENCLAARTPSGHLEDHPALHGSHNKPPRERIKDSLKAIYCFTPKGLI